MAGRNFDLSIIINALDKTGSTFKDLNKDLKLTDSQLNTIALTSAATFAAMIYGLKKATDAAAEQQAAEIKLAATMLNSKTYTDAAFQSNIKLADSLQWVSKYTDEEIIAAESMIGMFVKDNTLTQQLTKATLDLAAAKGMDLTTAANLVAKSVGSSTNALTRYGIEIEGAKGSTERAQMTIQNISNLFGGQAKAATLDYAGQMNLLKKQIGETQESIGMWLLPKLTELSSKIYFNISSFKQFIDTHKELVTAIGGVSLSFVGIIALVSSLAVIIPKVTTAFIVLGNVLKTHPILAIATILIPLILNWDKLRNSIDNTSTAGITIGKIMDVLKASLLATINVVEALGFNFKALYSAMTLNFKQAQQDMSMAGKLIAEIPKTVKDAYNNIDTTTKQSSKTRQNEEMSAANIVKQMQAQISKSFIDNNKIMTDDEKKMQSARVDAAYKAGDLTIAQYRNELQNRVNLLSKNHSDSLAKEQEYLSAKQSLAELDKNMNIDMVDAKYANQVAMAESQKKYDTQSYADALTEQQTYLSEKLIYLQQHQTDSLAAQQLYYDTLNLQRQNNEQLEILSQNNIKTGFLLMLTEMQSQQINWYNIAKSLYKGFENSLTSGFTYMFQNIGKGWNVLGDTAKKILTGVADVFFSMAAQLLAQWIMQHTAMAAVSTAFRTVDVANSAAVGAARAAAATAWTLWGAIGIGLAIGAAIMVLANSFATGTRGFEGGMALVGENGPELVNLPNGSDVLNNAETRNILSSNRGSSASGNAININIDFGGSTFMGTVDEITEVLSNKIYKNLKLNAVI